MTAHRRTEQRPTPPHSAAYSQVVAQRWQETAQAVYREASRVRQQVEAFSSQLSSCPLQGAEVLVALQVDLTIFRQRLEGLERRLARLEQVERAMRGGAPTDGGALA